jgi:hypothetical protein
MDYGEFHVLYSYQQTGFHILDDDGAWSMYEQFMMRRLNQLHHSNIYRLPLNSCRCEDSRGEFYCQSIPVITDIAGLRLFSSTFCHRAYQSE